MFAESCLDFGPAWKNNYFSRLKCWVVAGTKLEGKYKENFIYRGHAVTVGRISPQGTMCGLSCCVPRFHWIALKPVQFSWNCWQDKLLLKYWVKLPLLVWQHAVWGYKYIWLWMRITQCSVPWGNFLWLDLKSQIHTPAVGRDTLRRKHKMQDRTVTVDYTCIALNCEAL